MLILQICKERTWGQCIKHDPAMSMHFPTDSGQPPLDFLHITLVTLGSASPQKYSVWVIPQATRFPSLSQLSELRGKFENSCRYILRLSILVYISVFFVPFHVVRKALFTKLHGPVHKVNGKSSTLCGSSSCGSKPSRALFFEICDCVRQFGTCSEILKRMAWIWDGVCAFLQGLP